LQKRTRTPFVSLRAIHAPWSTETRDTFPEFREMIDIASRFVDRKIHFSHLTAHATLCFGISAHHHLHPAMQRLIKDWYKWSIEVWPEWSSDLVEMISIEEYRQRIARDLGKS
jgi:hypothetical protein